MATWKECELQVIESYLRDHPGAISKADHERVVQILSSECTSTRSVAAVKKKMVDLRKSITTGQQQRRAAKKSQPWTEAEITSLIGRYKTAEGTSKVEKIRKIMQFFPERSQKAVTQKLREDHPQVYYETRDISTNPDNTSVNEHVQEMQEREENILPEFPSEAQQPQQHVTVGESMSTSTHIPDAFRKKFHSIYKHTLQQDQRPRVKTVRKYIDTVLVNNIDRLLHELILSIKTADCRESKRRKCLKAAIYTAGLLLARENEKNIHKTPPSYVYTERKEKRLRKQLTCTKQLQNWNKSTQLSRKLKNHARELRNKKMTPAQFLKIGGDRLKGLQCKVEVQKARAEAYGVRREYSARPSTDAIKSREERQQPDPASTAVFYKELYRANEEDNTRETPIFDQWLKRMAKHRNKTDTEHQLQEDYIKKKISKAISKASPWKAPGQDGIPAFVYKTFPAARDVLVENVYNYVKGDKNISEEDVRARVILIYKSGDSKLPENYRPIAVLNTEYKILTAVITSIIMDFIADWMIPKQQLARKDVWGTVHGLLWDKACSQAARLSRASNYSAWFDFKKAYDSIAHRQLLRMVQVLPLHQQIRNTLKSIIKKWAVNIQVGKTNLPSIYVKKGVYQGDSMSPLLYILITACIVENVALDAEILKASKGKQEICAYMDDIKTHAPTKKAAKMIKEAIEESAAELGLSLNIQKSGYFTNQRGEREDSEVEEEIPFLPKVREHYKYLGLYQLERDTCINATRAVEITLQKANEIFKSQLAPAQKAHAYNTTVVPAAVYITGNLYPNESRATSLLRCADLDKEVRKLLVANDLLCRTSSRCTVYLPTRLGGLGITSLQHNTEIQYVRKGIYLREHPDMKSSLKKYQRLQKSEWRNPLSDCEHILQKYDITVPEKDGDEDICKYCRRIVKLLAEKQQRELMNSWTAHYSKLVQENEEIITFPALESLHMDSWTTRLVRSAAEEQVHGLGANPSARRRCRLGCNAFENAYHVISTCITPAFTHRHDFVAYWILKYILVSTHAPDEIQAQLKFKKANIVAEYKWGEREVKIRAGPKVLTDPELYHNRPDVIVIMTNPSVVYVLEIAVAHLQNIKKQEEIKVVRYSKNSTLHVTHENFREVHRDYNLIEALSNSYKCPAKLAVLIFGAFGEIVHTTIMCNAIKVLNALGIENRRLEQLLEKCSETASKETASIIMRRLNI